MDLYCTEFISAPSILELCGFSFSSAFYRGALQFPDILTLQIQKHHRSSDHYSQPKPEWHKAHQRCETAWVKPTPGPTDFMQRLSWCQSHCHQRCLLTALTRCLLCLCCIMLCLSGLPLHHPLHFLSALARLCVTSLLRPLVSRVSTGCTEITVFARSEFMCSLILI